MRVFLSFNSNNISRVEWKTLLRVIEWGKTPVVSSKAEVFRWAISQFRESVRNKWAERLRTLEACLKAAAKTAAAAYYVKLVALRGLQRAQVLLRQQLASSAPIERLILRDRPRQLFAARPPVAPPYFA